MRAEEIGELAGSRATRMTVEDLMELFEAWLARDVERLAKLARHEPRYYEGIFLGLSCGQRVHRRHAGLCRAAEGGDRYAEGYLAGRVLAKQLNTSLMDQSVASLRRMQERIDSGMPELDAAEWKLRSYRRMMEYFKSRK